MLGFVDLITISVDTTGQRQAVSPCQGSSGYLAGIDGNAVSSTIKLYAFFLFIVLIALAYVNLCALCVSILIRSKLIENKLIPLKFKVNQLALDSSKINRNKI